MEGAISASTTARIDEKLSSRRSNPSRASNTQTEQILAPVIEAGHQYRASPIKPLSIPTRDYGKVERALEVGASRIRNVKSHLEHNIEASRNQSRPYRDNLKGCCKLLAALGIDELN